MRSSIASLSLACLIVSLPAVAGVHHRTDRAGRATWVASGTAHGADGSLGHARASGSAGPHGRAVHGSRTTRSSDGTLSHQSGSRVRGADGGRFQAGRSVQRNPDGAMQAGYTASGQGAAGGSFQSQGNRTRTADGGRQASRETTLSGARASYAGSTTRAAGSLDHQSTVTGAAGNTYQGQTSYTKGHGVSHSGACTDAQGQTIPC